MKDEYGLDDRDDAAGAGGELPWEPPALQGGRGLFAESADLCAAAAAGQSHPAHVPPPSPNAASTG